MDKKKLSVKDIAEMAGTSVATVSRVINQNGRFSKETEKKVKSIIEKYGYEQNQLARGLRVKHTNTVGIMVPDIGNEFYGSITKIVQQELLAQGYMALICNTNECEEDIRKYSQMLRGLRIDGIIYIGNTDLASDIKIPTVYIDRDPRDQEVIADDAYVMVECDNIHGGYLAGKELMEKGVKHPCFVTYDLNISNHKKRLLGFKSALGEYGILLEEKHIISVTDSTVAKGKLAMEELLRNVPDVDGVFLTSDFLAFGAITCLHENGIRIPDQIRLVGFDDIDTSTIVYPSLTTIRQPIQEMGALAVHRIIDKINGKKIAEQRVRLPVELIVRATT